MTPSPEDESRDKRPLKLHVLECVRLRLFVSDLTQREIEKRVGFSRGYLSRLLAGTVEMKYWHLLAILHAMEIEPGDFFAAAFPVHRHPALEAVEGFRRQARKKPLSLELARLYAFGIESILDLYERLARCEAALDELVELGILEATSN